MADLIKNEVYFYQNNIISKEEAAALGFTEKDFTEGYKNTIAYSILSKHNKSENTQKGGKLNIVFDALASHDITYVGIIQTAKASGLKEFPLPYVLTNCHNSLCAVGGTINEDDHMFGLSAAKKYGGIYVPANLAVIHTYMREMMSGCGKMILGSDSHTRYGALGVMACGEGGPELVKQLLKRTYDINYPEVIAVVLKNKPKKGVGPQDVALSLIKAVFKNGFVKNKVLEFVGDGVYNLPIEFRNGIDVMTTETTCLSSIWITDKKTEDYFKVHKRADAFKKLEPKGLAVYDGAVVIDLEKVVPQIAMPFHPSNVFDLKEVIQKPYEILKEVEEQGRKILNNKSYTLTDKIKDGKVYIEQGVIAGCAGGTYDNIYTASNILKGKSCGSGRFSLSVYPSSQPIYIDLVKKGAVATLMEAGAVIKPAFCGPCFGAGDVPCNNGLSIRHTTRNFESREGSKPSAGQIASVALMDARSIAATAASGGILTSAEETDYNDKIKKFSFDFAPYKNRVYSGGKEEEAELQYGPNIKDWPEVNSLKDNMLVKIASAIYDDVTTTDELIPSGETSSYRSNPLKLSEFALSRKDPGYVERAKKAGEKAVCEKASDFPEAFKEAKEGLSLTKVKNFNLVSGVFAVKPGDGSAREQAASCQRVLGGGINIAREYATKRYRSNLINWGIIPFTNDKFDFKTDDIIFIPSVREKIENGTENFDVKVLRKGKVYDTVLKLDKLTDTEKQIILDGCLINFYKSEALK